MYVNPVDLSQIVAKFLFEDWKFDYCYDYANSGSTTHAIEIDGKRLKCNSMHVHFCHCFFVSFSFGMKPQSGKYKIKFKIDAIYFPRKYIC